MKPIDNNMKLTTVKSFTNERDEYGQTHTSFITKEASMFVRKYKQTITDGPIYNNIELIALTKDTSIDDSCNVIIDNKEYHCKFYIDSVNYKNVMTYRQLFLEIYG